MNIHHTPKQEVRKPLKLHNEVESGILQYINVHSLAPGAQLPTEAEFCALFKVSRSTVRHALSKLETAGVINRTRGRGTFLSDPGQAVPMRPTLLRRGSASRPSNMIGVVFSYASEIDFMQTSILRGIEHAVKSRGYNTVVGRSDDWDEPGEAKAIADLVHIGVSAFVVLPVPNRPSTTGVQMLLEQKIPVVLVDRYLTDLNTSYVVSDNHAGAYRATEHLILLGYHSFAFLMDRGEGKLEDQLRTTSIRDRYAGFCQALRDYNLPQFIQPAYLIDHSSRESVSQLLNSLRDRAAHPPALVALNDHIATEVINTAAQLGIKPPDDFGIVGFDDLPIASRLSVPLTTIIQPRYEIGFRAGHLLLDKMAGNAIRNEKVILLVSLVVRASCGAHRKMQQANTSLLYNDAHAER